MSAAPNRPRRPVVPRRPGRQVQEAVADLRFQEACHDMQQPVTAILSLAAAALAEPGLPGSVRSWLEGIDNEAAALAELIQQSLPRTGQAASAGHTNLGQLAHEVTACEQLTYRGQLQLRAPADTVAVRASRADVRRIIANLLSNATRAAGPGGRVTVRMASDHDFAMLLVEDSGPGFARIPPNTGIGSAVIADCLVRCGGRLQYGRSKAGGVKATVWLPLVTS